MGEQEASDGAVGQQLPHGEQAAQARLPGVADRPASWRTVRREKEERNGEQSEPHGNHDVGAREIDGKDEGPDNLARTCP